MREIVFERGVMTGAGLSSSVGGAPNGTPWACPECGTSAPRDERYTPWCEQCEWNLDPTAPGPGPTIGAWGRLVAGWAARRERRSDRAVEEVFQRIRAGASTSHSAGTRAAITVVAVVVHAITVGLLAAAVFLLVVSPGPLMLRGAEALVLFVIAWEVRPRFGRLPRMPAPLTPAQAPQTFALAAEIATAVGARPPELLVVTGDDNAAYAVVGLRGTRLLVIGFALWNRLDGQEKVAVLAHELGHDANGDVRREWPYRTAVSSLYRWAVLLTPSASIAGHVSYRAGTSTTFLVAVADWITRAVMAPLAAATWALARATAKLALRGGQGAEYRADDLGARAAGSVAMTAALRKILLSEQSIAALRTAVMGRRETDVWGRHRQAMTDYPEREIDRHERIARRRLHRVDTSHPPTHLRLDLIQSRAPLGPIVQLAPDREASIDAELRATAPSPHDLFS